MTTENSPREDWANARWQMKASFITAAAGVVGGATIAIIKDIPPFFVILGLGSVPFGVLGIVAKRKAKALEKQFQLPPAPTP